MFLWLELLVNWSSVIGLFSNEKRYLLAEFALPVRIVFMLLGYNYSMKLAASKTCCSLGSFRTGYSVASVILKGVCRVVWHRMGHFVKDCFRASNYIPGQEEVT